MRNLLAEKPAEILHGRLLASVNFVDDDDIKNKKILDIGCGYGWCELNFLKRGVHKIVGIEISENDLKMAKENVKNDRVNFKIGNAVNLPFENELFDTVVCWEVIEHIPKDTENIMFAEANRVLKKNGVFYLSTPFNSFFSNILDPAWWLVGHRHYSIKQLQKFAKQNDFDVSKIELKGGWWTLISIINLYVSKWMFKRNQFFSNFFSKREEVEYSSAGFVNIFLKFKKI